MKKSLVLIAVVALIPLCRAESTPARPEMARWAAEAKNVTIVRDDWGIAHVYGKTDADTVFGMIYAQSEDDFNRVETNYLNAMGRLAETEGEGNVYQDLRMKRLSLLKAAHADVGGSHVVGNPGRPSSSAQVRWCEPGAPVLSLSHG